VAAGLYALVGATALPFYPTGGPIVLALAAAVLAALRPRAGTALALAVPVLPLGNVAQGLAIAYALVAAAWFACWWRRPREAFAFAGGPLLAAAGCLGLLPLALLWRRGAARRAALAAVAVLSAALVSGLDGRALPFSGDPRPGHLAIDAANSPLPVARALRQTLRAEPGLIRLTLVLAAAAAVLPLLRSRGAWAYAAYGAAVLGCSFLPATHLAALPLVLGVWATCLTLALLERPQALRSLLGRARVPVRAAEPSG
jgi:hypothetical protein